MRTDWTAPPQAPPEAAAQVQGWLTALGKGDVGRAFGEMGGDVASFSAKSIPFVGPLLGQLFGGGGGGSEGAAPLPPWVMPVAIGGGVVLLVLLLRPGASAPSPVIVLPSQPRP